MDELLGRLEAWCAANRPEYLASLAPPADDSELARLTETFPAVPDDLLALFRWHNGSNDFAEAGSFVDNFVLMSADECIGAAVMLSGLLEAGDFDKDWWWDPRWVPFLQSWGGDLLCIDLAGCFGGKPGQVLEFVHDDVYRTAEFPSLRDWLACFIEGLEAGMFSVDDEVLSASDDFEELTSGRAPGYPIPADASGKREDGESWNSAELLSTRVFLPQEEEAPSAEAEGIVSSNLIDEGLKALPKAPDWRQGQDLSWASLFDTESDVAERVPGESFLEKTLAYAEELGRAGMETALGKLRGKGDVSYETLKETIYAIDSDNDDFCRRASRRTRSVDKVRLSPLDISIRVGKRFREPMKESLRRMGVDPNVVWVGADWD